MVVGVVVHAYLEWVMDACRRSGIHRVYFVSREGATLARAFNALARVRREGPGRNGPDQAGSVQAGSVLAGSVRAIYLPASRLSTFLPSLEALSPDSLSRLWAQYPRQTLRQLLRNLSMPTDPVVGVAARLGISPDATIEDLGALAPLFDDAVVRRAFTERRDAARAGLAAYLARKGFFQDRAIAMGDVGWKGSIQTNIERAMRAYHASVASGTAPFPNLPTVHGMYLALRHDTALATAPSTRMGFIADQPPPGAPQGDREWPASCIFRCGSMFEVALSVPHRCVAGYTARHLAGDCASAAACLLPESDSLFASLNAREREIFAGPARLTRIACLRTLGILREGARRKGPLDTRLARAWLMDLLRREIVYPTRASADSFLEHAHVETFGVFQPSRFDFVTPWREVFRGSPIHWPHRLRVALEAHFWPDGIVRRSGVPLANFAFDLMLTRRAR